MLDGDKSPAESGDKSPHSTAPRRQRPRLWTGLESLPAIEPRELRLSGAAPHMKTMLTFAAMLVVAPLVAATTLVCWQPDRWGGSVNPLAIAAIASFGVLSVPLWPTYIPALILTPLLMRRVSAHRAFVRLPLPVLVGLSLLVGAPAGACVLMPVALMASKDSRGSDLVLSWLATGAVSGAVTLTLISLIHRLVVTRAGPSATQNCSPAASPPTPAVKEGPDD